MDLEQAIMQLYEDESLTDELDDEAANELLKWGEKILPQIRENKTQNQGFEDAFSALRAYMKRVNYLIGQNANIEPEKQRTILSQMADAATNMGFPMNVERMSTFRQQSDALSAVESVQMMTSWVSSSSNTTTADTDSAALAPQAVPETAPQDPDETSTQNTALQTVEDANSESSGLANPPVLVDPEPDDDLDSQSVTPPVQTPPQGYLHSDEESDTDHSI